MTAKPRLKLADDTTRKPTRRQAFTKRTLAGVRTPAKGEAIVHDAKTPGLVFRVRPTGAKAFYFYRKIKGRPVRLKLGDFPEMTVENARKAATKTMAAYNEGKDPAAKRREERGELTVGKLWKVYRDDHLEPRCSPRTLATETALFDKHLGGLKSRRLSDVKPAATKALHTKIGKTAPTSANRAIQLLRRLYRYAARHHDYTGPIPTVSVELYREQSRERFLSADELPRFLKACDAEGQPWADFFRLCLATGARRSNVQAMRWDAIDTKAKTWTIPGEESKNGRDMKLPLTDAALSILTRRKAEQAKAKLDRMKASPFVFPAMRDKGGAGHLSQPARPFTRICMRAKIEGVTIHDLRRTAGAFLAASGASLPIIGKALGHADLRATQIYAKLDLDPVRAAMDKAAEAMEKGGKAKR